MANPTPGEPLPRSSSSATEAVARLDWARVSLLLLTGGAAAALHALTRGHLHLPGHQGLFWMALLGFVRGATGGRWSASVAGLGAGAAATLPFLRFHEPLSVTAYLVSGVAYDALMNLTSSDRYQSLRAGAFAAVAFATKPLLQGLATLALGWRTPVATQGLMYPLAMHLVFGFSGGLIGTWLWLRFTRARRST